jgi:hypothetical protein
VSGDDLTVQPAELVETIGSELSVTLDVTRSLIGRPDITMLDWDNSKRPRTWRPIHLRARWAAHRGDPRQIVTERSPWCFSRLTLYTRLVIKGGGLSESVDRTFNDLNLDVPYRPWSMHYGKAPLPEYVPVLLPSLLPPDWRPDYDTLPAWWPR